VELASEEDMKAFSILAILAALAILAGAFACGQTKEDKISNQDEGLGGGGGGGGGDDDTADDDTADDDTTPGEELTVALICNDDTRISNWSTLLTSYNITLVVINEDQLPTASFGDSQVILVDTETNWYLASEVTQVEASDLPILGMYEGGGYLFDSLQLNIGWEGGFTDSYAQDFRVVDASLAIFNSPYDLGLSDGDLVQVHSLELNLHYFDLLDNPYEDVTVLAERAVDTGYAGLTLEQKKYMYWGFQSSAQQFTDAGAKLLVNCLHFLAD
jgi:hypothetical protein